jgi:2-C-methyl-D-erythritol 4-phosphate cytidylyltransferase/2-C-methyl-D-erythritol 2,4-cyclodiphosphate synthase
MQPKTRTNTGLSLMPDIVIAAIVVAAGKGERAATGADSLPKQYRPIAGKPMLTRSIEAMLASPAVDLVVPVIHGDHDDLFAALKLSDARLAPPVIGGASRQESVLAGLTSLGPLRPKHVLIHDAARPFVDTPTIEGVIAALMENDGALPVVPVTDTIKRSRDGRSVVHTERREELFAAQTPQGFRFERLLAAHLRVARQPDAFTDDCSIAEWAGLSVAMTRGSPANFKVTHAEDFFRAEQVLSGIVGFETRTGLGYDVHPFAEGDAVWLCGVEIPFPRRLAGHSDADVALHALADALYGAIGEGDIGTHFPPSDMRWKGAASRIFVAHAAKLVAERGGRIVNLDVTIVAEAPKIGPHVPAMREAIAAACSTTTDRVAIKATTNEKIGFVGREEGIVAMATASIELPRRV